jgi:ubiquitin-like 1-activating enzyme E1 B
VSSFTTIVSAVNLLIRCNCRLARKSCKKLSARGISNPGTLISFDKDDDDTLDFVLATANLRATAYGIPTKTRFEVKGMCRQLSLHTMRRSYHSS